MKTKDRIINFFDVAALKCSCCGELGQNIDKTDNIKIIKDSEFYSITSLEEWENFMDKEINWLLANKEEVLSILPELESEWKESCKALKVLIKKNSV
ncbi:hypothetical protein HYX16_05425 [Candidatus Woesearchaeota archaeon]|nr:hypothetical protein [Candidatus Woesearchaeota archaeon]